LQIAIGLCELVLYVVYWMFCYHFDVFDRQTDNKLTCRYL